MQYEEPKVKVIQQDPLVMPWLFAGQHREYFFLLNRKLTKPTIIIAVLLSSHRRLCKKGIRIVVVVFSLQKI
ncbi:MAG: hypothetical protein JO297_18675 [Nitrososphaeraceae archaeon]|nr:hypothetical protein [Nitrososphaeraceae archaeon]